MFEGIPLVGLTAPGLVGIAVVLLLTGRIVPRATLRDKAQEATEWRLAFEKEREIRLASDAQTVELLEVVKTTNRIVTALFGSGGRARRSGESSDASMDP